MERPQTRYAKSGDVNIAYQAAGDADVDLVFAPGTVSHLDLDYDFDNPDHVWEWERFLAFCRFIRFDKRGTGLSDRVTHVASLEERTDDIRAVMDAVGSERAVILGVSKPGEPRASRGRAGRDRLEVDGVTRRSPRQGEAARAHSWFHRPHKVGGRNQPPATRRKRT